MNDDWIEIASGLSTTSFTWDTTQIPDGSDYLIKVIVTDRYFIQDDVSDSNFTIANHVIKKSEPSQWDLIYIIK